MQGSAPPGRRRHRPVASFSLSPAVIAQVDAEAERTGRNRSIIVDAILSAHFERNADCQAK